MEDLESAAVELGIIHDFNRSRNSRDNGSMERIFSTDEEEFSQVADLPADVAGPKAAMPAGNDTFETVRPQQALGYQTAGQFY